MSLADPPDTKPALEALLRWYADMGADAAIDDVAHDRFEEAPRSEPPRRASIAPVSPIASAGLVQAPADALVQQAEALAAGATSLAELAARWSTLPGCPLAMTAAHTIFAGGTAGARLMLIGGAPEADDEREGLAFAGAHGRLLDAMLRAIGHDRSSVYLANVVPWRPPGGRAPSPLELSLCLPFARRHIALAAPDLILCLGERAAQPLLGSRDPLSRLRGRWLTYEGDGTTVKTLATFSPDYLLKQPLQKRRAWADLQMVAAFALRAR